MLGYHVLIIVLPSLMHTNISSPESTTRAYLYSKISNDALITAKDTNKVFITPYGEQATWHFDFRLVFSDRKFLQNAAELFWSTCGFERNQSLQIGGLESAALPLITAIVLSGENTSGFYIRKSRKKKMEMRQIEGMVTADKEIVLVDDLINSGSSFKKQIAVLKAEGFKVKAIFTVLRFRDLEFYSFLKEEGIELYSIFSIEEFSLTKQRLGNEEPKLSPAWSFKAKKPHLFEQGPKHIPRLIGGNLLTSSDNGMLWNINPQTGKPVWQRQVILRTKPTVTTFIGTTTINDDFVFATYRGTIGAVSISGGIPKYHKSVAHAFTTRLYALGEFLVTGVSDGNGTTAYSLLIFSHTKQTATNHYRSNYRISGEIVTDPIHLVIFFADSSNTVRAVRTDGSVIWEQKLEGVNAGGVTQNEYGDVMVMSESGVLTMLDRISGKVREVHELPKFHYSHPVHRDGHLYGATLDREVYCYDIETKNMIWSYETRGRMYSPPTVMSKNLYVGDTFGSLHVINRKQGKAVGHHFGSERIVNPILVDRDRIFVSTFANEIYMFERNDL